MASKSRTAERHQHLKAPAEKSHTLINLLLLISKITPLQGLMQWFSFHLLGFSVTLIHPVPVAGRSWMVSIWSNRISQFRARPGFLVIAISGLCSCLFWDCLVRNNLQVSLPTKQDWCGLRSFMHLCTECIPTSIVKPHKVSFWNSRGSYFIYWQRSMERHSRIGLFQI